MQSPTKMVSEPSDLFGALAERGREYGRKRLRAAVHAHTDFESFAAACAEAVDDTELAAIGKLPLTAVLKIYRDVRESSGINHESDMSQPSGIARAVGCAESARILSFSSIVRARTTIDDFTSFYLPLHGLERSRHFFRWLPLLVFVEAMVYQADEDNEVRAASGHLGDDRAAAEDQGATMRVLEGVLQSRGLLTERVMFELSNGRRYWAEERRLCATMGAMAEAAAAGGAEAPMEGADDGCDGQGGGGGGTTLSHEEVLEASKLKSFEYRLLHALLCELSGRHANDELLRFLAVDEVLTDLADDLYDYEKDVRKNSFNALRGAVFALGEVAPLELAVRIGRLERQHACLLGRLSESARLAYCESRRAAMARAGSEKWIFPQIVLPAHEVSFRAAAASPRGGGHPGQAGESADDGSDDERVWASGHRRARPRAKRSRDDRGDADLDGIDPLLRKGRVREI